MIKTLKSELKLRPTYDEMIGMIESQGDPNRPSIETVIDRRATLFRNNQFGSQFDNIDFLGLKKQEEDRAKEATRQAQLRQAGIMAGASTATSSIPSVGFITPPEMYEVDASPEARVLRDDADDMTSEEATRIRAEMERYLQRQRETSQATITEMMENLDDVHRQSLPAGVEFHRINSEGREEDVPEDARVMSQVIIPQEQSSSSSSSAIVPSQPASSSTARDIFVSGAKAGVETLAKAGATALAKSFLPV